jgi:hypothetical protein
LFVEKIRDRSRGRRRPEKSSKAYAISACELPTHDTSTSTPQPWILRLERSCC